MASNACGALSLTAVNQFVPIDKKRAKVTASCLSTISLWKVWIALVESRTQPWRSWTQKNPRPRPRTDFPRTHHLEAKDRNARGQSQGHYVQALSKKRKNRVFAQNIAIFSQTFRRRKKVMTLAHF